MLDENQAPFVPSSETRACYHCPNTNCDGHYYLKPNELGKELICPKCGLPVTIGKTPSAVFSIEKRGDANYRHGFQRIFLVLTIAWMAVAFLAVFSGRSMPPWLDRLTVLRSQVIGGSSSPLAGWSPAVWLWAIGLSLIPPAIAYLLLFFVAEWVYRGFRVPKQT